MLDILVAECIDILLLVIPPLCVDQLVRGGTGDTVLCPSQDPVNRGHVSRFVLLSRVTSRDAVTL